MTETLQNFLDNFNVIIKKPQVFLSPKEEKLTDQIRDSVKKIYDFTKNEETNKVSNALPELIVQNFDLEQIWQEIELQNETFLTQSLNNVSRLVVNKDNLLFFDTSALEDSEKDESNDDKEEENFEEADHNENEKEENVDENQSSSSDDLSSDNENTVKKTAKSKTSIVDDEFFKLNEMEDFLNNIEKNLNKKIKPINNDSESESEDDESIDMFKDDDEEIVNPRYKDFFKEENDEPIKNKRKKALVSESDDESEKESNVESNIKSSLEIRQERLKKKIEDLEQTAISEKPWQLKGEITADNRPQNSLLEEIVEFDLTKRPAPVITEETTLKLEDIIRQRIKDKAFDSVERKEKPAETPLEYKKKLVLDQEKSKVSLAQIYEKEYIEQKEALNPENADKEPETPALHKEIKTMMNNLFSKLDALSNFHFTPKPICPELKIVSNLPAINMEEVAPVGASDAALLAPEEIKSKTKGDLIGKTERTDTDKKRERRKKKLKQKVHATLKLKKDVAKMKIGLGNKYSKEKAKKMVENAIKNKNVDKMDESLGSKSVKSSTAFFTQLQEEVKAQIQNKVSRKRKENKNTINAKKIKL